MGFNGQVLVGWGEAFTGALNQFWNWEEEVIETWPLCDGWRAVHVRSPADADELQELAEAAKGPILACEILESTTGHIRGISATGCWDGRLNSGNAAALRAWNTVDEQLGGNLYPGGTNQDHIEVERLTAHYAAEFDAKRPAASRAAIAWAAQSGLHADADRVEEVLATSWGSSVQHGLLALLSALGISSA